MQSVIYILNFQSIKCLLYDIPSIIRCDGMWFWSALTVSMRVFGLIYCPIFEIQFLTQLRSQIQFGNEGMTFFENSTRIHPGGQEAPSLPFFKAYFSRLLKCSRSMLKHTHDRGCSVTNPPCWSMVLVSIDLIRPASLRDESRILSMMNYFS